MGTYGRDKGKVGIGQHHIRLGDDWAGHSGEEGLSVEHPISRDQIKDQSGTAFITLAREHRAVMKFTLYQIPLALYAKLYNLSTQAESISGGTELKFRGDPVLREFDFEAIGPGAGPDKATSRLLGTVTIQGVGAIKRSGSVIQSAEITVETVTDDDGVYLTQQELDAVSTPPVVDTANCSPEPGDTGVVLAVTPVVRFSQQMDVVAAKNPANFALLKESDMSQVAISGITYADTAMEATLTLAAALDASSAYSLFIDPRLQSLHGKPIGARTRIDFTTGT